MKKCDIVLAGVGGQGVLSLASAIALAGMKDGMHVKQSEIHGMAQRGGAVFAHLRISSEPIGSDLIPRGRADVIISMEPLESVRYLPYLADGGALVTATTPVVNIDNYPDLETLFERIRTLPGAVLVDADHLAKKAGSPRASNMVLVGAASHRLPIRFDVIESSVEELFRRKGRAVVKTNVVALRTGRELTEAGAGMTE